MKKGKIRAISISAVMGAVGFVLMMLEFPLPFIIPAFIKFDFSEIPALITAFAFGPIYGILVCFIKNLIHLPMTSTMGVGELSNFLLGAIFVGVSGAVYSKMKSRKGALTGSVLGAVSMAVISVATNYFFVYPFYAQYMIPMDAIVGMYKTLLPASDTLFKSLVIFNLPFNLVKGVVIALVCFGVYKRISPLLKYGKMKNSVDK